MHFSATLAPVQTVDHACTEAKPVATGSPMLTSSCSQVLGITGVRTVAVKRRPSATWAKQESRRARSAASADLASFQGARASM